MLTVDVAAAETDLVELATVKAEPDVPDDGSADTTLGRLIAAASEAIAEHLGYLPWRQTYTETVPGKGSPDLLLSQMPVVSVSEVSIGGLIVTDYVLEDAMDGVLWRQAGWPWVPKVGHAIEATPVRNTERRNVSVTYVAGWLLPGEVGRDLPRAIEQAALETVVHWYGKGGTGASSSAIGSLVERQIGRTRERFADPTSRSTSVVGAVDPIPARALGRLQPYRRDIAWSQ